MALIPFDLPTFVQSNNCLTILSNKKTQKKRVFLLPPTIHPFTNYNLTCKYSMCAFKGLFLHFFSIAHHLLKVHALMAVYTCSGINFLDAGL